MSVEAGLELGLCATPQEVMRGCEALREFCMAQGVPAATLYDTMLAFEEVGTNIVEHGYHSNPQGRLSLRADRTREAIRLEICDEADAFNPLELPAPNPRTGAEAPERGLGVHIIRAIVASAEYSRDEGRNRLVLTLRLGAGGSEA